LSLVLSTVAVVANCVNGRVSTW